MTLLILLLIIIGVAAITWFLAKRSSKPKESSLPMVVPPSMPLKPVPPPFVPPAPRLPVPPPSPLPAPPFTTPL